MSSPSERGQPSSEHIGPGDPQQNLLWQNPHASESAASEPTNPPPLEIVEINSARERSGLIEQARMITAEQYTRFHRDYSREDARSQSARHLALRDYVRHELLTDDYGREECKCSTTIVALSEAGELAGTMRFVYGKESAQAGLLPFEAMGLITPPGGWADRLQAQGLSYDEVGELGRFAIPGGKFREHQGYILKEMLDRTYEIAESRGIQMIYLVMRPDRHEPLFEKTKEAAEAIGAEAERYQPVRIPGATLVDRDPSSEISQRAWHTYEEFANYWLSWQTAQGERREREHPGLYELRVQK